MNKSKKRKIFHIVCIGIFVVLLIGLASFLALFLYLESTSPLSSDQIIYQDNKSRYGIEISNDNIWPTDLDFNLFTTLESKDKFYLGKNLQGDLKEEIGNYYLDSSQGFYKVVHKSSFYEDNVIYLFGTDKEHINFVFCTKLYEESDQWYIKKGYKIPSIETNNVDEIIICRIENFTFHSNTINHPEFQRISLYDWDKKITDTEIIEKCIEQYGAQNYDFSWLKENIETDDEKYSYLVLTSFNNDSLYQCIGYF